MSKLPRDVNDEKHDIEHLPNSFRTHWTYEKKIAVVKAVNIGRLTLTEARDRYCLGIREYRSWEAMHREFMIKSR